MLGNIVSEQSFLTFIFITKFGKGITSGSKFINSVSFFGSSVSKDWFVNHDESVVFGDNSLKFVFFSVHGG